VAPEVGVVLPLLDSVGRKISQLEEAICSRLEEEGRALAQLVENVVQGPVEGFAEDQGGGTKGCT
jgi:hypothetical protein